MVNELATLGDDPNCLNEFGEVTSHSYSSYLSHYIVLYPAFLFIVFFTFFNYNFSLLFILLLPLHLFLLMIVLLIHSPLLPSTSCSLPQAPLCVAAFKGSGMIVEEMLKQPNIRVSTVCSSGGFFDQNLTTSL